MNEMNELEEFEHPYELEYSSAKESKNDSLKVKRNLENDKNNFNYQNNTLFGINNLINQIIKIYLIFKIIIIMRKMI